MRSVTLAGSAVADEPGSEAGSEPGSELAAFVVTRGGGRRLGAAVVPTAVEQFGLQPLDAVQFAFAEGWHEDELQPRTGLRWRWSSGESWIQVWPVDRDVRIRLVGGIATEDLRRSADSHVDGWWARARPGDTG